MPRMTNGSYQLPPGNPVTSGTTVSSVWANTTLPDLAAEINNSLARDGNSPMLGPLKVVDGLVSFPGVAFNSESGTGIYRKATSTLALSLNGGDSLVLSPTGGALTGGLTLTGDLTTTGNVSATGNLTAQNAVIQGTASITGASTIASTLAVTGAATLSGNTTVGGTLGVTGATTMSSLTASGNASVGGTINVTGAATIGGNTTVGGTFMVTGGTSLSSLTATTNASVNGTLSVGGNTTVGGTIAVTGNASMGGLVTIAPVTATAAANNALAGATQLTKTVNVITTASSTANSVILPTGTPGATATIINKTTSVIYVFGSTRLNGGTAAIQMPANAALQFVCSDVANDWWAMGGVYA